MYFVYCRFVFMKTLNIITAKLSKIVFTIL